MATRREKKEKKHPRGSRVDGPFSFSPSSDLDGAVRLLMNNRFETKVPSALLHAQQRWVEGRMVTVTPDTAIAFEPSALAVVRGMFPPGKQYQFELVLHSRLTSSGAGAYLQFIPFSPGVASYEEWGALSALFEEVRLDHAEAVLTPQVGSNGQNLESAAAAGVITQAMIIAPNPTNLSSSPTSYSNVTRLAGSRQLAQRVGDDARTQCTSIAFKPQARPFARTAAPATADPPAGCLGSFDIANSDALSFTTTYHLVTMRLRVTLRNRS